MTTLNHYLNIYDLEKPDKYASTQFIPKLTELLKKNRTY